MTDLFLHGTSNRHYWNQQQTLLYHTLDLDALIKKYSRHLQDKSMLAKLSKDGVIIQKSKYHISVL